MLNNNLRLREEWTTTVLKTAEGIEHTKNINFSK